MSLAPPVQYVTTSDGYDIAYSVRGTGLPFVFMPGPASHLQLFPSHHFIEFWLVALSARFRVIQYDGRGQGMSQRGLQADYGMDAPLRDLEAVVDQVQLDRFVLFGSHASGHTAVRYAIENPRRAHALVLAPCGTSGSAWSLVSALDLARSNWDFFLKTWLVSGGRGSAEADRDMAERLRLKECMTQSDWLIMASAWNSSDIEQVLPALSTPTLLLHPHGYLNVPIEESRKLASRIANARLGLIEGTSPLGDPVQGVRAIEEFLSQEGLLAGAVADGSRKQSVGADSATASLSPRQLEVLQLIAQGKTNREIAGELVLSERTVQRHIADLYLKIDVRNRAEATSFALSRLA